MTVTRMILFIGIAVYLIGLGFLIPAMNNDLSNGISATNSSNTLTSGHDFNFVTSITSLPLWFNTIFVIIPFVAWIIIGISLFFPTGNAGA